LTFIQFIMDSNNSNNHPPEENSSDNASWGWQHDENMPQDVLAEIIREAGIDFSGSERSIVDPNNTDNESSVAASSSGGEFYAAPDDTSDNTRTSFCSNVSQEVNENVLLRRNVDGCERFQNYGCGDYGLPLLRVFQERSDQVAGGPRVYGGYQRDYRLSVVSRRQFNRAGAERTRYQLVIEPPDPNRVLSYEEERDNLERRLQSIIDDVQQNSEPQDWFGMTLSNPQFDMAYGPIWIVARRADQLHPYAIMDMFDKVFQSHSMALFQDLFTVTTIKIKYPRGGGGGVPKRPFSLTGKTISDMLRKKTGSLVFIDNNDSKCLARAIVVGKAFVDGDQNRFKLLSRNNREQLAAATELLDAVGIGDRQCTLDDIARIDQYLNGEYSFIVRDMYGIIYREPRKRGKREIMLFYDSENQHFHTIKHMKGFLGIRNYCTQCHTRFKYRATHKCFRGCTMCGEGNRDCDTRDSRHDLYPCPECNRVFFNGQCFANHKTSGMCGQLYRCIRCNTFVDRIKRGLKNTGLVDHQCGEVFCTLCKGYFLVPHLCYMKPAAASPPVIAMDEEEQVKGEQIGPSDDSAEAAASYDLIEEGEMLAREKYMFVFYDFETCQEKLFVPEEDEDTGSNTELFDSSSTKKKEQSFEHQVNFAIMSRRCGECVDSVVDHSCQICLGPHKQEFSGENTLEEFCREIFSLAENGFQIYAIAHNSSGFDAQFVLQYCFQRGTKPGQFIGIGTKVLSMNVKGVTFLDSYRFLPMALSSLPKALGLQSMAKGDFPHLFNRQENWNYVGQIPDFKHYGADSRKPEEKKALYDWWQEQRNNHYVFDFQKEIRRYCATDVEILEAACLKFRHLFLKDADIDPFREGVTIASICNLFFRKRFLRPETIALVNPRGYSFRDRQSYIALVWLKWEETKRGIRIAHVGNGREAVVVVENRYKVDGYHAPTRTVIEFHGCAFHGCESCYSSSSSRTRMVPNSNYRTIDIALQDTKAKTNALKRNGYQVVEMWECDFRRALVNDPELKKFYTGMEKTGPINPRDAFFGGRTNAIRMFCETKPGERISYVDVCSLYPWVNKYGKYPVGHPTILTSNLQTDISGYEGLIKCSVLPPEQLFHPVLPVRINKKLMFPLCRTCANESSTTVKVRQCEHTAEQRTLHGTWVSDELKKAIEMGYTIIHTQEVWHFENTSQMSPENGHGLFSEYVNHFVKMKTEASGYPAEVNTEEEKDEYIRMYFEREGVRLDKQNIESNPGLRSIAKLALNSFWGKFAQRNNLDQVEYFSDMAEMRSYLSDETKEIISVNFPSEDIVQLQWRHAENFSDPSAVGNPYIAAYTTAQARLKLYSYLEILGARVLYFDTDSVIYLTRQGEKDFHTGVFLGDLTNELAAYGVGAYISLFVSAGPKNYAFNVVSATGQPLGGACKVRGISINARNSVLVNIDLMKQMVLQYGGGVDEEEEEDNIKEQRQIVLEDPRIVRTKNHNVITKVQKKTWRVVYDKRMLFSDLTMLPWGYRYKKIKRISLKHGDELYRKVR